MNKPEPGTTSNDNNDSADEGPVRWAGVDWSWSEHAVCVIDDTGARGRALHGHPHRAPGWPDWSPRCIATRSPGSRSNAATARSSQALLDAGLTVFVIASRQVTALRTRYGTTGNKDDRFDAYLLADVLRTDRQRLTPLTVDTDATVGLRMLIRARADLVKARVAAHNQLRAHLQLAHPGVVGLFHELDSKISLAFLTRFPTPRHARWLSEKRLAAWLAAARYTRPNTRTPAQLFDHLRQAPAGHPDGPAADAAQVITLELIALLRQPARADHRARDPHRPRPWPPTPTRRCSPACPAPGSVRAATLLAEIGDARGRYPTDEALAAAAGISPSTRASGPLALRRVPPRLQPPPAPGRGRLRRRQPSGQPLGPGRLRPSPSPRAQPRPRRPGPGPRLAAHHLALLDRPHPLRPRPSPRPHRPSRSREPAAHRHRRAHAAGVLTRADVVLDSGQPPAARRRCPGWPQATRRAPAWTPPRTAAHSPRRERPHRA